MLKKLNIVHFGLKTFDFHYFCFIIQLSMQDKDFIEWEEGVEKIKQSNSQLLAEFKTWLENKNLTAKTVKIHVGNVDFFVNHFLLRYDLKVPQDSVFEVRSYLGDFFIRKVSWASRNSIKENIISFKKFYTFLNETNRTSSKDLNILNEIIKEEKGDWLKALDRY